MRLRFGDCVFDRETRQLLRGGEPVAVPPKVFQLLDALITERPNAVSKTDLHARIWPDTFVSDRFPQVRDEVGQVRPRSIRVRLFLAGRSRREAQFGTRVGRGRSSSFVRGSLSRGQTRMEIDPSGSLGALAPLGPHSRRPSV